MLRMSEFDLCYEKMGYLPPSLQTSKLTCSSKQQKEHPYANNGLEGKRFPQVDFELKYSHMTVPGFFTEELSIL